MVSTPYRKVYGRSYETVTDYVVLVFCSEHAIIAMRSSSMSSIFLTTCDILDANHKKSRCGSQTPGINAAYQLLSCHHGISKQKSSQ